MRNSGENLLCWQTVLALMFVVTWTLTVLPLAAQAQSILSFNNPMVDERFKHDADLSSELDGNFFGDEEEFAADLDFSELSLSQAEVRAMHKKGMALSFASTLPWLGFGLDGYYHIDDMRLMVVSLGSSQWRFAGHQQAIDYEMQAAARAMSASYRWYLSANVPFYFQTSLAYLFWRGQINPSGVIDDALDQQGESAQQNLGGADRLQSSFDSHGPAAGVNFGISYHFASGWFIDYTLVGVAKYISLDLDLAADSRYAERAIGKSLGHAVSWELFNFKLGLMF